MPHCHLPRSPGLQMARLAWVCRTGKDWPRELPCRTWKGGMFESHSVCSRAGSEKGPFRLWYAS